MSENIHEGCSGSFEDGKQVVDKVRMMGFSEQYMPTPLTIKCGGCQKEYEMETFESRCPECGMVHAVTPCHAFDPNNVSASAVNY